MGQRSDPRALISRLLVAAASRWSARPGERSPLDSPWVRALLTVGGLQLLSLVAGVLFLDRAVVAEILAGTALPELIVVPPLALTVGGALLIVLGRGDRRAVELGIAFVLLACPFTSRWLAGALMVLPPPLGIAALVLRNTRVDAFFPFFLWRFAHDFPCAPSSRRIERLLAFGTGTACVAGLVFFAFELALVARAIDRLSLGLALAEVAPEKASYAEYGIMGLLTIGALGTLLWRARSATGAELRRSRLFALALALGIAPIFSQIALSLVWPAYRRFFEDPAHLPILAALSYLGLISVLVVTAYAVLVHHVLDVKLIARRALQYAFARYTVFVLAMVPVALLVVHLYTASGDSLAELLGGNRPLLLAGWAAVALATLRYRGVMLEEIDRRFFREQYDARQLLTLLVDRIRSAGDAVELAKLVSRGIDRALHLEAISVLVEEPRSGLLADPLSQRRRLDTDSELARTLAATAEPQAVDDPRSPLAKNLPEEDRTWLAGSGLRLLVPVRAVDGTLLGVLGLGEKKSGLPFLKEDRQLLSAVANSAAMVLELKRMRAYEAAAPRRRSAHEEPAAAGHGIENGRECPECGLLFLSHTAFCSHCSQRLEPAPVPCLLPGRFRFERRIGTGGMGIVYRATDLALGRAVAIKTLRRVSPESAMRLRREARTAAAVSHPHLAAVYGVDTWQGAPILVLELLEGGTLADRIERGRLEPVEAVELGVAMAAAIEQLHAADILHRDVKPSNIGYTKDGAPKLMDFGIARILYDIRREDGGSSTDDEEVLPGTSAWYRTPTSDMVPRQLVGTLSYLSPEALEGQPAEPSFDLWSLAIVLYECLLGRKVFDGDDPRLLLSRILAARVPPPAQALPDLPPTLASFFVDALHRSAERRPASAGELRRRLEQVRRRLAS